MRTLLTALIALFFVSAQGQSDMWYSKKAAVEGIQWGAGGSYFKPMQSKVWYWDEQNYCHCDDCCCGTADYFSIEFNTLIANPTINPAIVDTAGKGYYFDDCHYHFHSDLIQHTLYNVDGAKVAGGAKMGYDWVSSGTFNPPVGTNIHEEITSIDPTWVYEDIPETLPQYGQFVISGMRDDLYPRDYDGNRIILGRWVDGSYIGVKDGLYRLHSRAYFENLGLDEGANIYPNEWEIWIKIENDTSVTFDVEPPPIATTPTYIQATYSPGQGVQVEFDGNPNATYNIERWTKRGGNSEKGGRNEQLFPITITGNSFIDNTIESDSELYWGTRNKVYFYYKIEETTSNYNEL